MKGCGVMPREQITYERVRGSIVQIDGTGFIDNNTSLLSAAPAPQPPTVHVVWHKDPHGNGWAQFMFSCTPEYLRQIIRDQKPGDDVDIELYTEVLTRSECNKAVRAARTARDQAYGRDE